MKTILFAVAIVLGAAHPIAAQTSDSSVTAHLPAHDALFGLDKPKHFLLSAFIESAAFAGSEAMGTSRRGSMVVGVSATSVFALGREIHDRRTKGLFSFGDLVWDAVGAGAAAVMLRHTYR